MIRPTLLPSDALAELRDHFARFAESQAAMNVAMGLGNEASEWAIKAMFDRESRLVKAIDRAVPVRGKARLGHRAIVLDGVVLVVLAPDGNFDDLVAQRVLVVPAAGVAAVG